MMLTQTGFIISIAISIGLVASAVDPSVLLAIFSGTKVGSSGLDMAPFISALHLAFAVGVVASVLGAIVSASRGRHHVKSSRTTARVRTKWRRGPTR